MSDTTTTFAAALKEMYTKRVVDEILYKKNPFYKLVRKNTDFKGLDYYRVPLLFSPGGAVSYDFTRAQTNARATSTGVAQFKVDRVSNNAIGYVSDNLVRASKGDVAAFLDASKMNVEQVMYKLGRNTSIAMYRDGWGTRGQIATGSSVATTILTLSNPSDVYNFEVQDRLQVATTLGDAGKAYGSSGLPLIITAIDRDAGTLTFATAVNDAATGCPTIAAGDYIYIDGFAVSATKTAFTGLAGWLPYTAPTSSDSFFSLNRSVDPQKLSGVRVDGTQLGIIEATNAACIKVAQVGGNVSHVLCSHNTYTNFVNSQESKVRITENHDGDFGFPTLTCSTLTGSAVIVPDLNCPDNYMYPLQLDTWEIVTLGDDVHQIGSDGGDGLDMLRSYNSNDYELRYTSTGNLTCAAPGWNAVVKLS